MDFNGRVSSGSGETQVLPSRQRLHPPFGYLGPQIPSNGMICFGITYLCMFGACYVSLGEVLGGSKGGAGPSWR